MNDFEDPYAGGLYPVHPNNVEEVERILNPMKRKRLAGVRIPLPRPTKIKPSKKIYRRTKGKNETD